MRISMKKAAAFLIMLLVIMICSFSFLASAKTVSVGYTKETSYVSKANKKAVALKEGTTTLKFKADEGYTKFTAIKSGTYKFTFNNLSATNDKYSYGAVVFYRPISQKLQLIKITTEGGKTDGLLIATKNDKSDSKVDRFLKKRTTSLDISSGETVYVYYNFAKNNKLNVNIKLTKLLPDPEPEPTPSAPSISTNTEVSQPPTPSTGGTVLYTPSGECYHSPNGCRTLSRSRYIYSCSEQQAVAMGRRACKVCH